MPVLRNIFILYMAPGNHEQMVHYQDTIKKRVSQERLAKYLSTDDLVQLRELFGVKPVPVWGSRDTRANRGRFDRMQLGDDVLIVEGSKIKLLGRIGGKVISPELSMELWMNLKGEVDQGWDLIYFIANPVELDLPFSVFKRLMGYLPDFSPRGFTSVSEKNAQTFYTQYDDLYSVLVRMKYHQKPESLPGKVMSPIGAPPSLEGSDTTGGLTENEVSDHARMQCKLLRLGKKAGARVWVPKSDQKKMQEACEPTNFPRVFSSGLDVPGMFVENIDVIWNEEFNIHAAFEVENSTSVYSGLLRFSDLKVMAPNHLYPLFIVAPLSRKNIARQQFKRPTFGRLGFDKEFRYLSYQAVDEVDNAVRSAASVPRVVELLKEKSELLSAD